ncbi:hypothetical protein Vadar_025652 [Vaccinium darrowii]|uniref:Uncharacterized protein n=1 Tax=Vaccinium darrowii TaxID=229202 RepID=A0ACB7YQN5_9ERIC|nr:hypothetical protein Vadar_025652 [Vaccinium darrowii]
MIEEEYEAHLEQVEQYNTNDCGASSRFSNDSGRDGIRRHQDWGQDFAFVDNIPDKMDRSWLTRIFNDCGVVNETYIPIKRSKKGSRFAFVKYDCPVSSDMAISRANGMKIGGQRILVKKARFEKNDAELDGEDDDVVREDNDRDYNKEAVKQSMDDMAKHANKCADKDTNKDKITSGFSAQHDEVVGHVVITEIINEGVKGQYSIVPMSAECNAQDINEMVNTLVESDMISRVPRHELSMAQEEAEENIEEKNDNFLSEGPLVFWSETNDRASQMQGINLEVDLNLEVPKIARKELRKRIHETYSSSGGDDSMESFIHSIANGTTQNLVLQELQSSTAMGVRMGIDFSKEDIMVMSKLIEEDANRGYWCFMGDFNLKISGVEG